MIKSKYNDRKKLEERRQELILKREKCETDWGIDAFANARFFTSLDASEMMTEIIKSDKPCLVGRLGETEARTIRLWKLDWFRLNDIRLASSEICNNAGFFPRSVIKIKSFCDIYMNAVMNTDHMGVFLWRDEEYLMARSDTLKSAFPANVLDPIFMGNKSWMSALEDKRLLVVSPFADSIEKQYAVNHPLFSGGLTMPKFDLKTIKAIQSVGGKGAEGFKDWFDALEYMKRQIDKIDFDIALLGCGAYGMPLGSYIKDTGRKAIYVGGSLQLMFGIIGKRWEDQDYVKKHLNEYWIRPNEEEKPKHYSNVENGCYW